MDKAWGLALIWLLIAVVFDLLANYALKLSEGFSRLIWGIGAVVAISLAMCCMGQAVLTMPLSIAYALWSVLGIIGTTLMGRFWLGQHLSRQTYAALVVLSLGIVLMNVA